MKKVRFITFDGVDGVGKTTILNMVAERLQQLDIPTYKTRAVGGDGTCDFQQSLRAVLLHPKFPKDISIEAEETFFSIADMEAIEQAASFLKLNQSGIVLKDRGLPSHVVFSLAKDASFNIEKVHSDLIKKEKEIHDHLGSLHIIFAVSDVGFTLKRVQDRSLRTGVPITERLENVSLQTAVAKGMLEAGASPYLSNFNIKVVVVKEQDTPNDVYRKTLDILRDSGIEI